MISNTKTKVILLPLLILTLAVFLIPQISLAQDAGSFGVNDLDSANLGTRELKDIIALVINIFLGFLGIIAVGLIIYAGFLWMTAQGEADKIADAKKIMINAAIGLVIILSAYAITAFIISRLGSATGVGPGGGGGGGGDDDGFDDGRQRLFRVTSIQPRGQLRIRNVVAQISFSQPLNAALIGENNVLTNQEGIRVERANGQGGFERVAGALTIDPGNRQRVLFSPQENCPEPNQQLFCFGYDADNLDLNLYRVTVLSEPELSLRSVGGLSITCNGNSCMGEFRVGGLVDTANPVVDFTEAINRAGQHFDLANRAIFSLEEVYQLFAQATDDGGLTSVDFYIGEDFLNTSEAGDDSPLEFLAQAEWATNNLQPQVYELAARAYDAAGHQSALGQASVLIRPAHCFNNQQDENLEETGIDCGGECGACEGDPCGQVIENRCTDPDNQICASNVCNVDSCLCQQAPRIMAVDPDNGAIGNWVTISGRGFGNQAGRILLNDIQGRLPRFCQASWTDTQIILELPAGLDIGNTQLSVVTSQGLASNSVDFSVNDVERPGICQLIPREARPGGNFALIGYQFGNLNNANQQKTVYFGGFEQNLLATEPTWRAAAGRAIVSARLPNLNPGQTSVRVRIDGQDSNALSITVLPEENYPNIVDFEPKSGNVGQYVNIYGTDFGSYQEGQSKIIFNQDVEGSFDFPAECRADNSFWQDDHIIVKVPEGVADGAIKVQRSDGRQDTTDQPFDYQADAELAPGICSLYPREGRVGSTFDVAGEYFNNGTLKLGNLSLNARPDNQNRHFNGVAVPEGARSGPVKVVRGELQSNGLDFSVIAGEGEEPGAPSAYYQWQFTTCENCVVPQVAESQSCDLGLASPTPRRNSLDNFVDTLISATFNTDMNNELFDLDSTVVIDSCGNGQAPGQCAQVQGVAGEFTFGQSHEGEYFTLALAQPLQTSTWYQVTLQNLRSQQENLALAEPYVWTFKTRNNNAVCEITSVSVNPNQRLISNNRPVYLNDRVMYQAQAINGENCNICPNSFVWSWESSNQNQAEIDRSSRVYQSLMTAKAVTHSPVSITATASDDQGHNGRGTAIVEIVPRDFGLLYSRSCSIQPQSPSPYASVQNACLNAKISAQFNSIMTDGLLSADALTLKQRGEGQSSIPITLDRGIYYEAGGRSGLRGVIFKPDQNLRINTWYEVTLNNNLANADGGQLVGQRSWQFKTQNNNELCQFDSVLVNPGSAVLGIGASQNYTAETLNGATCQLVKEPDNLSWSWRSENEVVATVGQSAVSQNSALARVLGETKIRAQALGVENTGLNGNLNVTEGAEPINLSIIGHQPVGQAICQNALGQVRFNLGLDPATVSESNFIIVEHGAKCPQAGCSVISNLTSNQNKTIINLLPKVNNLWKKQTRYEIKVRGGETGVKTQSGEFLTDQGCPADMTWQEGSPTGGEAGQSCSWSFTIGESVCEVAGIKVEPSSATINIGAFQEWSAYAQAEDGTILSDPIENWRSANANVANVEFDPASPALAQSRGTGQGQTTIAAFIGTTIGTADLRVNDILNGPRIIASVPQNGAEGVCRNALVKIEFDKLLNKDTVNQNNFKLEYRQEAEAQPAGCRQDNQAVTYGQPANRLLSADSLIGQWLNNWAAKIFSSVWGVIFNKAKANVYWCPIQGQWLEEHAGEQSQVHFSLTQALPPVSTIRTTVIGGDNGLKALNGMPLAGDLNEQGNYSYTFSTGPDVCDLAFVTVAADPTANQKDWTFTTSFDNLVDNPVVNQGENDFSGPNFDTIYDADKKYTASGFSLTGEELMPIAGVYEWSWQWQTSNQSVASLDLSGPDFMVVRAQNKNGQSEIKAVADFPDQYQKQNLSANAKAIVDICLNRWNPTGDRNPDYKFIDPNYNFSLSYCRDAGGPDPADDLPALFEPQALDRRPDNDPAKDDLLREYLIPVPTTGDLLGLRIYANNLHLSPVGWYQKNITVKGQPVSKEVDGYQAIQDGRTVYVAAANARPRQIAFNNSNVSNFALAKNLFNNLWQGVKNGLSALFFERTLAQFEAAAANYNNNRAVIGQALERFNNQGIAPADFGNLENNLAQARADYDRAALLEAGANEAELNAYEADLAALTADLTRYQGLVSANADLERLVAEIRRLQLQGAEVNAFIDRYNRFNQDINNGLQRNDLTDFENQVADLQTLSDDLTAAFNIEVPAFNADVFRLNNDGYQVQDIASAYTNVYLLSYNQNAHAKTMEIVKRLQERWHFNSNIDNPDLNEKLRRDVKRLADLTAVSNSLTAYQNVHGNAVPALTAGTFLSGRSNSKWPSWNQTLAPALSASLPVDPINKFNSCIACVEPQLVNAGFEQEENYEDQTGWRFVEPQGVTVLLEANNDRRFIKEGNGSLSVIATGATAGVAQSVSLLPNTTYELSAWVYLVSGKAHLTFWGDDYGNEWISPPDVTGWVQLKNRLVTNPAGQGGPNNPENGIFIRSHEGQAEFYVDAVAIQTAGGNCGYDPNTCWNPMANQSKGAFACDAESYFYSYQTLGNNNYLLAAKMETTAAWLSEPANPLNPHFRLSTERVLGCTSESIGGHCGDGIINGDEQCEPGMSLNYCPRPTRWYTPRSLGCEPAGSEFGECTWVNPADHGEDWGDSYELNCGGRCGDGHLNTAPTYNISPNEECDASIQGAEDGFSNGVINGSLSTNQYACSASCRDIGGWCGDNIIQPVYGEACDGNANGWSCADGSAPRCSACGVVCDSGTPFQGRCGDGVKQPQEACDASAGLPSNTACSNSCQTLSCRNDDYAACDGSIANGCEISLQNDRNNCGECGLVCQTPADGTASCSAGACAYACIAGYAACTDNNAANGCETDLSSDINNCGACGDRCAPPAFGTATCNAQGCGFTCTNGFERQGNQCVADCGDGIILGNEVCDDGDEHNGDPGFCSNQCNGMTSFGAPLFIDNFETDLSNWERGYNDGNPSWTREVRSGNYKLKYILGPNNVSRPRDYRVINERAVNLTDVDILVQVDFSLARDFDALVVARHNGSNNVNDQEYYALWNDYNNYIQIRRIKRGDGFGRDQGLVSEGALRSGNYWLQFRVYNEGNAVKLKARWWLVGQVMPDAWNLTYDDTTNEKISGSGKVGLAGWPNTTFYFDNFQVYGYGR